MSNNIISFENETLENYLRTQDIVVIQFNRMSLNITFGMDIVLRQIRPSMSITQFHTGVLEFGTRIFHRNFDRFLMESRVMMQETRGIYIDLGNHDNEVAFGGNWVPEIEARVPVKISAKPSDRLMSDIGTLQDALGAKSTWIQRACIAQALMNSEYLNDGNEEKTQWGKRFQPYVAEFEKRLRYKNRKLQEFLEANT